MTITFFLNSTGFPIPYKQETEAMTKTSLLPDKRAEEVLMRRRSMSATRSAVVLAANPPFGRLRPAPRWSKKMAR